MMNKRQLRKELEEKLRANGLEEEVWQAKPWTAIKVAAEFDGEIHQALGFTKVQYPDVWDPHFGIGLARDKAIAKIAKAIVEDAIVRFGPEGADVILW